MKVLIIENSRDDFLKSRSRFCSYLQRNGWKVHAMIPAAPGVKEIKFLNTSNIHFHPVNTIGFGFKLKEY